MVSLGANVVLAARSAPAITALASDIGPQALACPCDVADWPQVAAMIESAQAHFGTIDVLVGNAGVIDPIARLDQSDPVAWGQMIDVNLKGIYHGIRAALPVMLQNGGGTIINISSGAATGALEGWSHYCASKAAVLSLTRCTDKEYRDHGIRVMGLSPGTVATEMQVHIKASGINPVSQLDPNVHIPPEWVAKGIAFLCTPEADRFLGTDFTLKTDEERALAGLPPR